MSICGHFSSSRLLLILPRHVMKFLWISAALRFKLKKAFCWLISSKLISSLVSALTYVPPSLIANSRSVASMKLASSSGAKSFI